MRGACGWLLGAVLLGQGSAVWAAEAPAQFVQRAVDNELAKDRDDHSHWLYVEVDLKPSHGVRQWVADTSNGSLRRVLKINGRTLTRQEQEQRINAYLSDPALQAKQHKGEAHDDKEAEELLELLPRAFVWTMEGEKGSDTVLHFRPDPSFQPPDLESKVFAAMEGDMKVDTRQHRIASLKGQLIKTVKIFGGLLGELDSGGTFDVERRETGPGVWQITETHVHIHGHALIFKNISEQEDDVKWDFKPLSARVTMLEAKQDLLNAKE